MANAAHEESEESEKRERVEACQISVVAYTANLHVVQATVMDNPN